MVGEINQYAFLIPIDASSFAEFEISEFEIARVDCNMKVIVMDVNKKKCVMQEIQHTERTTPRQHETKDT